jgi:hypothetical protein
LNAKNSRQRRPFLRDLLNAFVHAVNFNQRKNKMSLIRTLFFILSVCIALTVVNGQIAAADLSLYNSENNVFYTQSADGCAFMARKLERAAGVFVPADYDGDGIADPATWEPANGLWTIYLSSTSKIAYYSLGSKSDVAVPADYDGDGRADIAIWDTITGVWKAVLTSGNSTATSIIGIFGNFGDIPVPADYNGDGKADPAVFRPVVNRWLIAGNDNALTFEIGSNEKGYLIPADFDGDGKADPAFYSGGKWIIRLSRSSKFETFFFGFKDDMPAVKDYDGDGIADFATYRDGRWYFYLSRQPEFLSVEFGRKGDLPVLSTYAKSIN